MNLSRKKIKKRYLQFTYLLIGICTTLLFLFFPTHKTLSENTFPEINLVSGTEVGEYYALAKNIETIAKENNLDLDVIPTKGSLQNIHDVFSHETIPLGIAQGDTLAFLNTFANDDEQARLQSESLKAVLPLYAEQVHVITRKDITSIAQLEGKTISLGNDQSGSSMTASTLLYQWGIKPKELVTYDIKRAISALRNQEIDALFYVVGFPAEVLEAQILPEDNFHLLPVSLEMRSDDDFYNRLYNRANIPANTYSWQKESVQTLAIQSYLITTSEANCGDVNAVANVIRNNLNWLQSNGNSIWRNVDLQVNKNLTLQRFSSCSSSSIF